MSDKTGYYATHHHDLGKKPLWNTEGLKLPAYIQNVAAALMRDHGMDKSKAIATAVSRCKKWAAGGPDVSPEVRAAAQKAVAEWEAAKARARSTPDRSDLSGNLGARTVSLAFDEAAHPRAAAGSAAGGQFVAGDSGGGGQDKKGKGKTERQRLIDSLMSKKGADYRKLAAEEAAKKAKSGAKGKKGAAKKSKDSKGKAASGAHLTTRDGAEPSGPKARALHADTGGKGKFSTIPARSRHARDKPGNPQTGEKLIGMPMPGGKGVERAKARQAIEKLYRRNGQELRTAAKGQGWRKKGDWYVTMQRRGGTMETVGIRQMGIGFQVSRNGQTSTYRTLAEARQAAA